MAIYKRGQGFELGMIENKSSKSPEWYSNPGLPDCESDVLTTRQCCLIALGRVVQSRVMITHGYCEI